MIATALAIGLVVGLATGALGGGGSVLTVPALVFLLGEEPHAASTASLVIVGISALTGLAARTRTGHVQWRAGVVFGLVGAGAAVAGTVLGRHLDPPLLLLGFAALILFAAVLLLRGPSIPTGPGEGSSTPTGPGEAVDDPGAPVSTGADASVATIAAPTVRTWAIAHAATVVAVGAVVGFATGLFGVGGGFLVVPALAIVLGWSMPFAVATSLLVIVLNSVSSLAVRVATETFDWRVIAVVTAASVVGTVGGKLVADRASSTGLARSFVGLLVLVACYTAVTSVIALTG